MNLNEIAAQYSLVRSHSRGRAYLMRWSVRSFGQHLGHEPTAADLTDAAASSWLASLEPATAPSTRAAHRTPEMVRCYIDRRYYRPRGVLPPAV